MTALTILPSGHLHVAEPETLSLSKGEESLPSTLNAAFKDSLGKGLFTLACTNTFSELSSLFHYWQQFSKSYMAYRCQLAPDLGPKDKTQPLTPTAFVALPLFDELLASPPTMMGAEYLCMLTFKDAWEQLDGYLCQQANHHALSLREFLKQYAPQWHQLGRVCLHLAENKQDPDYPFAFMATYVSELNAQDTPKYRPLGQALQQLSSAKNTSELIHLLSPLNFASKQGPIIKELIESGDIYHPLAWSANEAYQFIQEIPHYEAAGLTVRLPDWWKKRARPTVSVSIGNQTKNTLSVDALLDFSVTKTLGDSALTQAEWDELMAAENGLIFFKGQWVEVDKDKLTEALHHWQKVEQSMLDEGLSFAEGMRLLAGAPMDLKSEISTVSESAWSSIQAGEGLHRLLEQLRQPETLALAGLEKTLQATLRPYQQLGVEWLWTLTQLKLGACLADDMGLGKTLQIIALLLIRKKNRPHAHKNRNHTLKNRYKPSLLVLPASLLMNWKDELAKFAPSLRCVFVHPSQKLTLVEKDELCECDLVLTTYGMLTRESWLTELSWQWVILDEAQAIKNPGTKQSKAVKRLRAESRIALTGTPVENRPSDLWSLFDFICPGLLGSAKRFQGFTKSLSSREQDPYGPLRKLVQPYILRRLKTDKTIISDLPDKTEVNSYYHLSKKQAAHYKKAVSELLATLDNAEGIQRKGVVLSFLLRFKQICNHPAQWLGNGDYVPKDSGKFLRLAELCEEIASRQEKVLVFTQFRAIIAPLADFMSHCFGRSGLVLHGGTSVKQRKKCVDAFQQETGPPFFVLSIKAGGTGLNLTQASHVIHFDRWWNPAVENQATDRAFRIGQKNNVMVHKMVCRGTIEEKIDRLIAEKQAVAEDILSQGTDSLLTEMTDEALIELVSLDVDQVDL
ncbi:MAG: superfamily II DNA or RNA helicase [Candidatus Endobugula sp.]|jgi:superfamily II DNA or RNA helicase